MVPEILRPDCAAALGGFLSSSEAWRSVYGVKGAQSGVERHKWLDVPMSDRIFHFEKHPLKATSIEQITQDWLVFMRFQNFLSGPVFLNFIEAVTGISLPGTVSLAAHRMTPDHFLHAHNDKRENRRFAFIFYFSPGWPETHGGQLSMVAKSGATTHLPARLDQLTLFDVHAHKLHELAPVSVSAPEPRLTIGGWISK